MIATGLLLAQSGKALSLLLGYGVFIGLLGNAAMNAPVYIYVSRWFDRRRGTALALLGSGSSVSAAIWAPIFSAAEAQIGWRNTMLGFAVIEVSLILPAAALMLRPSPKLAVSTATPPARAWPPRCSGYDRRVRYRCLPPRVFAVACQWRCRKAILWLCALMSGFRHPSARRCSRCCSAAPF